MLIELVETGPRDVSEWYKGYTEGCVWRLFWYRTEPPEPQTTYRVDILDEKGTTLLYSEEAQHEQLRDAVMWAEKSFIWYMMANGMFPPPGVFKDKEDMEETERKLATYRRK